MVISAKLICTTTVNWLQQQLINVLKFGTGKKKVCHQKKRAKILEASEIPINRAQAFPKAPAGPQLKAGLRCLPTLNLNNIFLSLLPLSFIFSLFLSISLFCALFFFFFLQSLQTHFPDKI